MANTDNLPALPVCIADLDAHTVSVSPMTLTETVVELFETNPHLPGVMVMDRGRPTNIVTRLKLFERLGHRYGIELFMRKPIIELNRSMRLPTYIMPGHMRVDDAVRQTLQRPSTDLYDPIIVEAAPDRYQLLEINLLLTTQSQIVAYLSNAINHIAHIDSMLQSDIPFEHIMQHIFSVLRLVIPHHQVKIALPSPQGLRLLDINEHQSLPAETGQQFLRSAIYTLLVRHQDALYIPDTRQTPKWNEVNIFGTPKAWLGVPILRPGQLPGVLSIGRYTTTPFDITEKETSLAFAARIATLLQHDENNHHRHLISLPPNPMPVPPKINVAL